MDIEKLILLLQVYDHNWDHPVPKMSNWIKNKDALIEKKLIKSMDDPENDGYYLLEVTNKGRKMVEMVFEAAGIVTDDDDVPEIDWQEAAKKYEAVAEDLRAALRSILMGIPLKDAANPRYSTHWKTANETLDKADKILGG